MPQITVSSENRLSTGSRRADNIFKIDQVGDSARVVMFEDPTFAWVHQLRAPRLENGRPVKVMKKRKTRSGGEEQYEDFDMDFVGRPLCLGDLGVLADKGVDPVHCPACKAATEGGEVNKPERRFAVNVIRYALKDNNNPALLAQPFRVTCEIWTFPESGFDRLAGLAEEYESLIGRDLVLGPLEQPKQFQRLKGVTVGAKDAWKIDETLKALVQETYASQRLAPDDLEDKAIGRRAERRFIEMDLDKIADAWRQVNAAGTGSVPASATDAAAQSIGTGASLAAGLDDLLGATPAPAGQSSLDNLVASSPAPQQQPMTTTDFADLLGDPTPATPAAAPAQQQGQQPASTTGKAIDFDQLLDSIG